MSDIRRTSGFLLVSLLLSVSDASGQWGSIPVPSFGDDALLYGVHAVTMDDAWAVGRLDREYAPFGSDQNSLTLHWNGEAWSHVPSPSPGLFPDGGIDVQLNAVDGVASDDIWAAGTYKTQHVDGFVGFQPLLLHWDGVVWEQVEAPFTPVGTTGGFINDLLAVDRDDVYAFGQRAEGAPGPRTVGFFLHWNGSRWSELPSPPTVTLGGHTLREAVRLPDGRILAIGGQSGPTGLEVPDEPYAVVWDGDAWSDVSPPNFAAQTYLRGVARSSNGEVWVVGDVNDGIRLTPLLLRWDGGDQWTRATATGFDPPAVRLEDAVALADGSIVAVGLVTETAPPAIPLPLFLRWDGETWTVQAPDPDGATDGWLRGVAATRDGCMAIAVGQQGSLRPRIDRLDCGMVLFEDGFESGDMSVWQP